MTPSSKVLEKKAPILHSVPFHTWRDRCVNYTVLQYKKSKSSQPGRKLESRRAALLLLDFLSHFNVFVGVYFNKTLKPLQTVPFTTAQHGIQPI